MKRRELMLVGGAALARPFEAGAQQARTLKTIGYLGAGTEATNRLGLAAFVHRLGELGWVEGRSVTIDNRPSEGLLDRAGEIAAEFVRLKVDVIVAAGDAQVLAVKRATATIPIVFAAAGDPVGNGLVASLARPGGNVTGLSTALIDTAGKRLELLREVVPGLRRLVILGNLSNPTVELERGIVQAAAHAHNLEAIRLDFQSAADVGPAIRSLDGQADALYVCLDPLASTNAAVINASALAARLPVMQGFSASVAAGGLISYAPDRIDLIRRAAELVNKILRGAKPADIPVEQPTKFELVLNMKTAKALGLTIPPSLLARADEVIE